MPVQPPDSPPVVLCLSASDATGGGGLQSDLLTLGSMGCHPLAVMTSVCVRDTRGVEELVAIEPEVVALQARVVLEDIPVQAFKLGMCGGVENVAALAEILADYPDIPLVLEPALACGPRDEAESEDMLAALAGLVLPQVSLMVTSEEDLLALAGFVGDEADGEDDGVAEGGAHADEEAPVLSVQKALARVLACGTEYVLLTGGAQAGVKGRNRLFGAQGLVRTDAWARLPGSFLGAGATLSAAAAAALAHGMTMEEAVGEAQEFTHGALSAAFRPGMGKALPDRFFWARPHREAEGG